MKNKEQKVFEILDKSFNNHWNSTTDLIKKSVAKEIVKLFNSHNINISVCPECGGKDIRPYKDHLCCYECGNYFKQSHKVPNTDNL